MCGRSLSDLGRESPAASVSQKSGCVPIFSSGLCVGFVAVSARGRLGSSARIASAKIVGVRRLSFVVSGLRLLRPKLTYSLGSAQIAVIWIGRIEGWVVDKGLCHV